MAANHINISIGSSFNAEGFNKLSQAASDATKTAGKIANSVGQIGGAIGGLDGTVGKVTGAVSNLFQSFAIGGPIGVAIAGVTALVGWMGKIKKEAEESKAKLEQMAQAAEKARLEKAFRDAQESVSKANTALDEHLKKLKEAEAAAERLSKAEKAVSDANERLGKSQGNLELANLQSEIQQRVAANGWSPSQKQIEQAKGNVELQQLQNAQALEAARKEVEKAKEQLQDATRSLNALERSKSIVQAEIDEIEGTLSTAVQGQKEEFVKLKAAESAAAENYSYLARTVGDEKAETVKAKEQLIAARSAREQAETRIAQTEEAASAKLAAAKKQLAEIKLKLAETSAAEDVATRNVEAASTNLETARVEAATAERQAQQQLKDLQDATEKEARARLEAAEAEKKAKELKANADSQIRNAEINAAKQINGIDGQIAKLKTAIQNAELAMQNAANGVAWANQHNWGGWGHQEFNADNFDDFRRAGRFGGRANRDANSRKPGANRKAGWERREEELAKRLGLSKNDWDNLSDKEFENMLNGKAGRKLSNAEKNWLRDKRNWDNQQGKDKNQKNLERLQQARNKILENLKTNVQTIKDNLDKALTIK